MEIFCLELLQAISLSTQQILLISFCFPIRKAGAQQGYFWIRNKNDTQYHYIATEHDIWINLAYKNKYIWLQQSFYFTLQPQLWWIQVVRNMNKIKLWGKEMKTKLNWSLVFERVPANFMCNIDYQSLLWYPSEE